MEEVYNKHYITVDEQGRVTDGWSDGPHSNRDTSEAVLLTAQGGYQFRLCPGGEENPVLFDWDGMIPLYKWDGGQVIARTTEEIEADRLIAMQPTAEQVRAERYRLLTETDWTQVLDAPIDAETREAYRVYRQALRDVPEQEGFPQSVVWPELPAVGKAAPDPVDTAVDVLLGGEEE